MLRKTKSSRPIRTWSTRYHLILRARPPCAYPLAHNGGTVADYTRRLFRPASPAPLQSHFTCSPADSHLPSALCQGFRRLLLFVKAFTVYGNKYTTFPAACQQKPQKNCYVIIDMIPKTETIRAAFSQRISRKRPDSPRPPHRQVRNLAVARTKTRKMADRGWVSARISAPDVVS